MFRCVKKPQSKIFEISQRCKLICQLFSNFESTRGVGCIQVQASHMNRKQFFSPREIAQMFDPSNLKNLSFKVRYGYMLYIIIFQMDLVKADLIFDLLILQCKINPACVKLVMFFYKSMFQLLASHVNLCPALECLCGRIEHQQMT